MSYRSALPQLAAAALVATLSSDAAASGDAWTDDFQAARERAKTEGKDLLLEFTGSDWCPPCMKLTREVFSTEKFQDEASKRYVLVIVDNPRGEDVITPEVRKQNDALHATYAVNAWPTIFLADADGRPYARSIEFSPGSPDPYLKHLAELQPNKAARDEAIAKARELDGTDRARMLDEALRRCGDFLPMDPYKELIDEIISADADNEAGLRMRWETRRAADQLERDLPRLGKAKQWPELVGAIDGFLDRYEPSVALRQKALYWRGIGLAQQGKLADAKSSLEDAVRLDPEGVYGKRAATDLKRMR